MTTRLIAWYVTIAPTGAIEREKERNSGKRWSEGGIEWSENRSRGAGGENGAILSRYSPKFRLLRVFIARPR